MSPQGSVLGPILWNTMYDGIFRLPLVGRTEIVGFVDDVALLVVDKHPGKAEEACNKNIRAIKQWLSSMGLKLMPEKTEAVLISSKKVMDTATVEVGSTSVASSRAIKYLGVIIDTRLSFREHLADASSKAAGVNWPLSTIMLNTRGPKQASRRLLMSATRATMLYAAPVWAKALEIDSYAQGLRSGPIANCGTTYLPCLQNSVQRGDIGNIASSPLLDLLAQESKS